MILYLITLTFQDIYTLLVNINKADAYKKSNLVSPFKFPHLLDRVTMGTPKITHNLLST